MPWVGQTLSHEIAPNLAPCSQCFEELPWATLQALENWCSWLWLVSVVAGCVWWQHHHHWLLHLHYPSSSLSYYSALCSSGSTSPTKSSLSYGDIIIVLRRIISGFFCLVVVLLPLFPVNYCYVWGVDLENVIVFDACSFVVDAIPYFVVIQVSLLCPIKEVCVFHWVYLNLFGCVEDRRAGWMVTRRPFACNQLSCYWRDGHKHSWYYGQPPEKLSLLPWNVHIQPNELPFLIQCCSNFDCHSCWQMQLACSTNRIAVSHSEATITLLPLPSSHSGWRYAFIKWAIFPCWKSLSYLWAEFTHPSTYPFHFFR